MYSEVFWKSRIKLHTREYGAQSSMRTKDWSLIPPSNVPAARHPSTDKTWTCTAIAQDLSVSQINAGTKLFHCCGKQNRRMSQPK